ncbi:MAG: hypothetical protein M1540_07825 [Candidatus Bathyarchaeota archaeon]|nr:hypothetical protein [Candidatus Bathyarchaeota archaeon]
MIKLRIDVDYPYQSRAKSFLQVALRIKTKKGKDYLANAHIIARMINESPREVRGYWFFTPYTMPDKKLLEQLNPQRHEIALHVANKPIEEWKKLEKETNRKVEYYTIHGTEGRIARLLWGRKSKGPQIVIPSDFSLMDFQNEKPKTLSIDRDRYKYGFEKMAVLVEEWIAQGVVLSFHPEWLFKSTEKSQRGPVYDLLKSILKVDTDLNTLSVKKKSFFKIAHDVQEYEKNAWSTNEFLEKLKERGVDVYTFLDRKWCCPTQNPLVNWRGEDDNVGLLEIKTYPEWLQMVGKKTRNMIRKAEKEGVKIAVVEASDALAEGIWKIYNETPIRQERAFSHYGESLELVKGNMYASKNNTFVGAYLDGELIGFIQLVYGDNIAITSNILSLQKHWDKAVNNALLAKAVEVCAGRGQRWLMYGRIGNHPSLDRFKDNNGFVKFLIKRYYIPLTSKGRLAIRLGLHRELKDALPEFVKKPLFPVLNWVSRTKVKVKMRLRS